MDVCRVVAVDVGSVRGNFAWAGLDLPSRQPVGSGGTNPEEVAQAVSEGLECFRRVALGFERPLFVPVPSATPESWPNLGRGRTGEGNRSWSAGGGTGALATGLVQTAWVLQRLTAVRGAVTVTTQSRRWLDGEVELLLWEAFVSGPGKPVPSEFGKHAADAAAAADTFDDRWASGMVGKSDVTCLPHGSLNLAAAAVCTPG
jgi:hypothetical protein